MIQPLMLVFIVAILFVAIFLLVAGESFASIKPIFQTSTPLDEIKMSYLQVSECSGSAYKLKAEISRPALQKRTLMIPAFIFRGKVYRSETNIVFEETQQPNQEIISRQVSGTPPAEREQFVLALFSDDSKCRQTIESNPTFEKLTIDCGQFSQKVQTLTISAGSCVSQAGQAGQAPQQAVSVRSTSAIGGGLCEVHLTVTNTENSAWTESSRVKVMVDCIQENYIPPIGSGFIVLPPGGSVGDPGTTAARQCPVWDENQLRQDPSLLNRYQSGWKIRVFKGCTDDIQTRCTNANEIISSDFRC